MIKKMAAVALSVAIVSTLSISSFAGNRFITMGILPDGLSNLAGTAKEKANEIKDSASKAAGDISDKAGEAAQSVTDKIDEATARKIPDLNPAPDIPKDAIIIEGKVYNFDKKDKYSFTQSEIYTSSQESELCAGTFFIQGSVSHDAEIDGMPVYAVVKDSVSIFYSHGNELMAAPDEQWHLFSDSGKDVDNIKLNNKIGNGVLIIQTSVDGDNWVTVREINNAFEAASPSVESLYTSKPLELMNGCYYRLIAAYELEKKTGTKKVGLVNVNENDYKKQCEIYSFYLTNKDSETSTKASVNNSKTLGTKEKTKDNSGYSQIVEIDQKDPHFGWDLGSFFVTGYTSHVDENGNIIFLKNVGDKVTLWFNLKQNINELNGNPILSIAEDKDGWDKYFEIPKTNFKHGALIIRKIDYQGVKQEPVIYTDFLAANVRTGADTKIVLFEEGDYEVSLDYQIKKTPRQVAGTAIIPEYSDYKIAFRYSIRNGNCMVYPFDVVTQNELADSASTENGFKLDMAKSRYLKINVKREVLNENTNQLDTRFNRTATDGEEYTDPGVYTFTVKNEYTGESTTKVIYVGDRQTVEKLKMIKK